MFLNVHLSILQNFLNLDSTCFKLRFFPFITSENKIKTSIKTGYKTTTTGKKIFFGILIKNKVIVVVFSITNIYFLMSYLKFIIII